MVLPLTVGENGLASGGGEGADLAPRRKIAKPCIWIVGEEEDAARSGPQTMQRLLALEDARRVGPEAAVPEAIDVAVDQMYLVVRVEDQRGAGGELAVEDDLVGGSKTGVADSER